MKFFSYFFVFFCREEKGGKGEGEGEEGRGEEKKGEEGEEENYIMRSGALFRRSGDELLRIYTLPSVDISYRPLVPQI